MPFDPHVIDSQPRKPGKLGGSALQTPGTRRSTIAKAAARGLCTLVLLLGSATLGRADYRILTSHSGATQIHFEDLARVDPNLQQVLSDHLALRRGEQAVPLWVDDGGDGWFGPGDVLSFVAEKLGQDGRYYHDTAPHNAYWLSTDAIGGLHGETRTLGPPTRKERRNGKRGKNRRVEDSAPQAIAGAELVREVHLEEDRMMIRLSAGQMTGGWSSDLWFWEKLTHLGNNIFEVDIDLSDRSAASARPMVLRAALRALNQTNANLLGGLPGHRVEVLLLDEVIGAVSWNGSLARTVEMRIDPRDLPVGPVTLRLRIPSRTPEGLKSPIVDVVMVNWVEVEYAIEPVLQRTEQKEVSFDAGSPEVRLQSPSQPWSAYFADGRRVRAPATDDVVGFVARLAEGGSTRAHLVVGDSYHEVDAIEVDRPSSWRDPQNRADYLMIAHPRLLEAVRPLAEFHRERGLEVALVDVQDVYDEFSGGVVTQEALRDFVRFTQLEWQEPAPRFVLLVGDASWDIKNEVPDDRRYANYPNSQFNERGGDFAAQHDRRYTELGDVPHRNLIPTAMFASSQGHAASDNYFVSVIGDDFIPDLAIGRLPVVTPEEVSAIVDKTIRYASAPEVGPWRAEMLWITNEERRFQMRTDLLAEVSLEDGFAPRKVYPQPEEKDNVLHQARLQSELNSGKLLVHFLGHGGRFIWRTGPPDISKNHDLFTPEHIDQLEPTERLPMVLSMTCFSAPFDHPDADSIGEKFLRTAHRGAVAVFAASWRNAPSQQYSDLLVDWLTRPGTPIGTAVLRAKQGIRSRELIETYNLLGDPAIPLALPGHHLQVAVEERSPEAGVRVRVELPFEEFSGQARVRWLDENGEAVSEELIQVEETTFSLPWPAAAADSSGEESIPGPIHTVQIYAWSEVDQIDAFGSAHRTPEEDSVDRPTTSAAPL